MYHLSQKRSTTVFNPPSYLLVKLTLQLAFIRVTNRLVHPCRACILQLATLGCKRLATPWDKNGHILKISNVVSKEFHDGSNSLSKYLRLLSFLMFLISHAFRRAATLHRQSSLGPVMLVA